MVDGDNLEERSVVYLVKVREEQRDLLSRYSSLDKLIRVTARIMQAVALFRRMKPLAEGGSVLTPEALGEAQLFWVKRVQLQHFADDITNWLRNDPFLARVRCGDWPPFWLLVVYSASAGGSRILG